MSAAPLLVIGVGREGLGDDAAGLEVARLLRARGAPGLLAREADGQAAELLDSWRGFERVVLIDAARSGRRPGSVMRYDAAREPLPATLERGSTHGLGVAEAVELARALGQAPRELRVIAIEGRVFGPGAALSPEVRDAAARVADELRAEAG